ncbi:MAG: hypothetical protein OXE82_03675, partial [Rhodobacter sp.]|nr:hypothetical protein [Rhodobacter sp.]
PPLRAWRQPDPREGYRLNAGTVQFPTDDRRNHIHIFALELFWLRDAVPSRGNDHRRQSRSLTGLPRSRR